MDLSTIKDLYIGSKPVQSAWLGGTKVWERRPAVDIQSIFDAMVLWYDPKRQGATNENMAENPVLTDLSGNGHDATCYNFGWGGMSGVGSYTNFSANPSRGNFEILGTQKWLIKSLKTEADSPDEPVLCVAASFNGRGKTLTIKVDGIPEDSPSNFLIVRNNTSAFAVELHNGDNIVTFSTDTEGYFTFMFENVDAVNNITIEVLPEYPNALVADGMDDYALVEGLPLLDDYTVIAKREWITKEYDDYSCFAAKSKVANEGSFIFERWKPSQQTHQSSNFGAWYNYVLPDDKITYQTASSYNGIISLCKGDWPDSDILNLFSLKTGSQVTNIALYSFILFNRTLTNDEIEWVKDNLIEGTYRNPESLMIDAWIFSGHTNEEAPTQITGEKGTALSCYNFAWNEEGSGFKDGELCFDKVDDYLINENMPLLDDFTVIMRRTARGDAGAVVYKGTGRDYNNGRGGAFQLEILYNNNNLIMNRLFGKTVQTQGVGQITLKDEAVSFTPTSIYKGLEYEQNFERVSKEDGPVLKINSPLYLNNYCIIKMKYFALYSKTLTNEEIQSEKQRLDALWESRKQ